MYRSQVTNYIEGVSPTSPKARSALIGSMSFASNMQSCYGDKYLLDACRTYLDLHLHRPYFFNDIRRFFERLNVTNAEALVDVASQTARSRIPKQNDGEDARQRWLVSEVNCLKLDFFLSLSKNADLSDQYIDHFATNVLQFCATARALEVKDSYAEEEACLLGATALEKISTVVTNEPDDGSAYTIESQSSLLQSMLILQDLLKRHPHNSSARILLVKLSRSLGLVSISMEIYSSLGIREIQHETLSHLLYCGISTLHPFEVGGSEKHRLDSSVSEPYRGLEKILTWYDNAADKIDSFLAADVDSYRYDKVKEFHGLKIGLDKSITKEIAGLERRRIARLADRPYDETDLLDFQNSRCHRSVLNGFMLTL